MYTCKTHGWSNDFTCCPLCNNCVTSTETLSCPPPVSAEVVSHNEWFNSQSDVRQLLLLHPDGEMIERSCLHFLGDDAQAWWVNRKSSPSAPVVAEQAVTLLELEPGELFEFDGTIALKSEYRTEKGAVESYIVGSGEMFWGGTDTAEALNNLLVKRISLHSPAERIEGDAVEFEVELLKLINKHVNAGLKKPDLVHKMEYVTTSCKMS